MSNKNGGKSETQEQLTIFVETLTGTTFEVKVSPQDRVKTIKSKIQKVEGIPVSHQHLLYNSKELQDSSCVTEPSVALHDRATIKLVLTMRGGPISLVHQAVSFNRNVLKNLLKFNREELEEDLPPGCKMAILVLRVGDQLNLLHIVDDGDDSNDSLSNSRENLSIEVI
uniref:Ubiquitin-like domain-containing protein n=1 Tax=Graphocephala atropunctata TaxID=36148 RepID=A0A1B6MP97_9HEMI